MLCVSGQVVLVLGIWGKVRRDWGDWGVWGGWGGECRWRWRWRGGMRGNDFFFGGGGGGGKWVIR